MKFKCSKCKELKPESEFRKNPTQGRGYCYYCRDCENTYARDYYHKKLKSRKRWLKKPKRPKNSKAQRKTKKKPQIPEKKVKKREILKVSLRDLCSKFESLQKTTCHMEIHRLAKAFNDEGKLKISFTKGYNVYVFCDKEAYEEFMSRAISIKEVI